MGLSYTWTRPDESQIELELDYDIASVEQDGRYYPCVTITEVQPESHAKAFYAAFDSDAELWPFVQEECLADWSGAYEYAEGDRC